MIFKGKGICKTFIKTFYKSEKDFIKQDDISMTSKVSGLEAAHWTWSDRAE
jgi:hypothetical protein